MTVNLEFDGRPKELWSADISLGSGMSASVAKKATPGTIKCGQEDHGAAALFFFFFRCCIFTLGVSPSILCETSFYGNLNELL